MHSDDTRQRIAEFRDQIMISGIDEITGNGFG